MNFPIQALTCGALLGCALLTGCGSSSASSPRVASLASTQTSSAALTSFSLTSLMPPQGSEEGDTEVTLRGAGFAPDLQVSFDGVPAASVVVVSSESALCRTPVHQVGFVDVALRQGQGQGQGQGQALSWAGAYEFTPARIQRTGALDLSFAGRGFVTRDERGAGSRASTDSLYGVTTDGQGRIVAVGESSLGRGGTNRDMILVRYLEDGTPDPTFGAQGRVTHAGAAGGVDTWDKGEAVAIDSLGRIVVTGRSYNLGSPGDSDFVVWRYLDNGDLDTSFNGQGFLVHDSAAGGFGWDSGQGLAIDPLGRIVIAGYSSLPLRGGQALRERQAAVWRINADGRLDATFGRLGVTLLSSSTSDEAFGVAIDSQGGILVGGEVDGGATQDVAVWRLDDTGASDPNYGVNGRATHHGAAGGRGADAGYALALDPQDRALVAGRSVATGGGTAMVVWRFLSNGALDTRFGGQGFALLDDPGGTLGGTETAYGVAVEPLTGSIVVVGNATGANSIDATVWQLLPDGAMDFGFGNAGVFQHDNAAGGQRTDQARAVTLDAKGRALVVGTSWSSAGDSDSAIWRVR